MSKSQRIADLKNSHDFWLSTAKHHLQSASYYRTWAADPNMCKTPVQIEMCRNRMREEAANYRDCVEHAAKELRRAAELQCDLFSDPTETPDPEPEPGRAPRPKHRPTCDVCGSDLRNVFTDSFIQHAIGFKGGFSFVSRVCKSCFNARGFEPLLEDFLGWPKGGVK